MTDTTQFRIGVDATCSDGSCGELSRVVVDPVARTLTHLVVEPKHRKGLGRLVPLDLIEPASDEIRLRCTLSEFDELDRAEETEFLPFGGDFGYRPGEALFWPYFGLGGLGIPGQLGNLDGGAGVGVGARPITVDTVPSGEVAIRRGERVHAIDGDIGRVEGLIIEPANHQVTHVLLQHGHLWGQTDVAIPISMVTGVVDGIHLNVTKKDVEDLPPVGIDR